MANGEAEDVMKDKSKHSRFAQVLSALAGDDFNKIINAIKGSPVDFSAVLGEVQGRMNQVRALEERVKKRQERLNEIDAELQKLADKNKVLEEQINVIRSRIQVHSPQDAAKLSGTDLLGP